MDEQLRPVARDASTNPPPACYRWAGWAGAGGAGLQAGWAKVARHEARCRRKVA